MNLSGKRIVLTGAAGGIGYRLALLLASRGAHLAL
jgi:NAD(P)-dependent dehydrogenase (short-subunit alcohol dehydrogenase family)